MSSNRKAPLRAVAPGEKPPAAPVKPETIVAAVEMDERALLVALRDKIAKEIDAGVPPAYLAPVVRQLREVDKAIRQLDAREEQEGPEHVGGDDDQAFDASAI